MSAEKELRGNRSRESSRGESAMIELSKEQIERAAQAAFPATGTTCQWDKANGDYKNELRRFLAAAAPFLQLPLAPPTEEEIDRFYKAWALPGGHTESFKRGLVEFTASRNAQFAPPVSKREKIVAVLHSMAVVGRAHPEIAGNVADAILALDEKETK